MKKEYIVYLVGGSILVALMGFSYIQNWKSKVERDTLQIIQSVAQNYFINGAYFGVEAYTKYLEQNVYQVQVDQLINVAGQAFLNFKGQPKAYLGWEGPIKNNITIELSPSNDVEDVIEPLILEE